MWCNKNIVIIIMPVWENSIPGSRPSVSVCLSQKLNQILWHLERQPASFSCCIPAVRSVAVVVSSLQPCNAVYANVFSVIQTGRGARPHSPSTTSTSWRTSSSVPSPRWSRLWWLRTKFPLTTGALNFITELLRWFSVWAPCWCVAGKSRVFWSNQPKISGSLAPGTQP